ncbi:alpha/beta hydrolase-fold protein [Bacteroides heparinolyticus]|uniref:Esterase n=4 Tax=Prevotella heparinolytica TaxID=28113 RepID=A0A3P2ADN7_9BACE|nr:alpha/beta hydrolase-fold protein [Bacteroides heparinolyticus]MCF0255179.1 esterase [Bacteroides heparinolyticus]MCI6212507.1 alpha/beta hydrolase-fold protein [Bacteroides heparinolyticus]RRD92806.1 esterase [Bacteroides heparinolyticus]VFB13257.1 glycoside hydrolase [Bacteroides heparinolyticus]
MNRFLIFLLLQAACFGLLQAQPRRQSIDESTLPGKRGELNVRNAMYPRLLPDNRMEFKVKAPDAKKVQIDLGRKYDLVRNAEGEWSGTTDPLAPGFHYYFLIIDGVAVADPASESFYGCSMMTSGVEIPYPDGDTRFYMANVPHGDIRMKRYFSTTANDWRRMFVYCPPGYDMNQQTYPVLYLQHGGGEDERGWSAQGRTDIIMDNLIAKGEAVPMIIVMTDGNTADFERELLNDCIPFVEKNFRVKTDRESRALAGLSMGGIQTLNTGLPHLELFAYLGVFSSGWWASPTPFGNAHDTEKYYTMLKEKKDEYNARLKQFWLSMGGKEDIAYNNCQIMMKRFDEIGIKYSYFETPGGHTWPVWRESLYQFAPLLFK